MDKSDNSTKSTTILTTDDGSLVRFRERYKQHLWRTYGLLGQAITNGIEHNFVHPTAPHQNASKNVMTKYQEELKQVLNSETKYKADKVSAVGDMLEHLSEASLARVLTHQEYQLASSAADPIRLWKCIIESHTLSGAELRAQKMRERTRLKAISQNINEETEAFCKRYSEQLERCTATGIVQDKDTTVGDFLSSLDKQRFKDCIHEVYQKEIELEDFEQAKSYVLKWDRTNSALLNDKIENVNEDNVVALSSNVTISNKRERDDLNESTNITKEKRCKWCMAEGKERAATTHSIETCWKVENFIKSDDFQTRQKKKKPHSMNMIFMIANHKNKQKAEDIILDSGATVNVFNDKKYLKDIVHKRTTIKGINGDMTTDGEGYHQTFGKALLITNAPINVISYTQAKQQFNITFEQKENQFTLTKGSETYIFKEDNGLYKLRGLVDSPPSYLGTTETRPTLLFSTMSKANQARKLHESLDHPYDPYLVRLVEKGTYRNLGLTSADFRQAEKLLGPCKHCLMAKMAKETKDGHYKRANQIGEYLHMDIIFLHGKNGIKQPVLFSEEQVTGHLTMIYLPNSKNSQHLMEAMDMTISFYRSFQHVVKRICTDREVVFSSTKHFLNNKCIQLHQTTPGSHESFSERMVRSLKNRSRATLFSLDYDLPMKLLPYLYEHVISSMNMTGNNKCTYQTPKEMVTQTTNYPTTINDGFGTIGVFHNGNIQQHRDLEPRGEIGIIIGREYNSRSIKVFLIKEQRIVWRSKYTKIHLDENIKHMIQQIDKNTCRHHIENDSTTSDNIEQSHSTPNDDSIETANPNKRIRNVPEDMETSKRQRRNIPRVDYKLLNEGINIVMNLSPVELEASIEQLDDDDNQLMALKEKAIENEIEQLITKQVFKVINLNELSLEEKKAIIPSRTLCALKYSPEGKMIKVKARTVAGGHRQVYDETFDVSSPTVRINSISMLINVGVYLDLPFAVFDISGAYLNALLPPNMNVHMWLDKHTSEVLCKLHPEYIKFKNNDGRILTTLLRALYGLRVSALLWYQTLVKCLTDNSYIISKHDSGVLYKVGSGERRIYVMIHVDDILAIGEQQDIDQLQAILKNNFHNITMNKGNTLHYLGMVINRDMGKRECKLTQPALAEAVALNIASSTPASENLFESNEFDEKLDSEESLKYRSILMQVMYLCRTRPDIKLPTVFLTTRMQNPTKSDLEKLNKIRGFIHKTKSDGITFKPEEIQIYGSSDASWGTHTDGKSHTGVILTLGKLNGPITVISSKQTIVTRSSTEAELLAANSAMDEITWMRGLLEELGFKQSTVTLKLDNKSTITIIKRGPGRIGRTKHINVRYFAMIEQIQNNAIKLEFVKSEEQMADGLTKPLPPNAYKQWRKCILNISDSNNE